MIDINGKDLSWSSLWFKLHSSLSTQASRRRALFNALAMAALVVQLGAGATVLKFHRALRSAALVLLSSLSGRWRLPW